MAAWADGLVTINQPVDVLRDLVAAYRDAGGAGPLSLQVHLSWAPTRDEAEAIALDQWRTNVFTEPVNWDTETPEAFDVMAEHVGHRGRTPLGGGVGGPRRGTATGSPSSRPSASTTSTCTSSDRSRQASSTRSASTSFPPCGADADGRGLLVWVRASD